MAHSTSKNKVRIAFIGAGGIAGAHMDRLATMDDVEIVAQSDISEASMKRYAEKFNIPASFTDYQKMLDTVKPDAVSVCTPNGMHAPASIAALKAGAHVIVEKPLAMNAVEGQAMVDAAKEAGKKLVIAFQYRYSAQAQMIRKQVMAGKFGNILYARSQALRRRGIPNWGVFGRKELQGGGPLIDIGVHMLEVTHYCMGSPRPVSAVGNCFTYLGNKKSSTHSMWPNWDHKTYNVEDLAVGMIRFENGAMLTLESSFVAHIKDSVLDFSLMGEKAGADWHSGEIFEDRNDYMVNSKPAYMPEIDGFTAKLRNFIDHIVAGKPSEAPGEDGLMVQKMLDAIYKSAETGKEVIIA